MFGAKTRAVNPLDALRYLRVCKKIRDYTQITSFWGHPYLSRAL